ncbi:MAG TPA: cysteine desulfurase family protein [Candidatus Paceibacterota bacterium]|nr:cysteine desulfurase family protein [Candidatus Paceibacterota bacterium]
MKRIYLDHAAATPVDAGVLEKMHRLEREIFANPSALYREGLEARKVVETARREIAEQIAAHADEIIFAGSGTEANNLALLGLAQEAQKGRRKNHVLVSAVEHPSVLECAAQLRSYGFTVEFLPVSSAGVVEVKALKEMLRPETLFVSVMYANNEIGTVEPIKEIAKILRKFRKDQKSNFPYLHTDACQATNYLDMNVQRLGVDLMTWNSPKIYGPKGAAALFKKRGIKIAPIVHGGGQEHGLRSATEDTARIFGFAEAMKLTGEKKEAESARLAELRDFFIQAVEKEISCAVLNGSRPETVSAGQTVSSQNDTKRLPNNVNFSFLGHDAEEIVLRLDAKGIAVSARSACASLSDGEDELGGSYVVRALGQATVSDEKLANPGDKTIEDRAFSSVRFTLGRGTTKADIEITIKVLKEIMERF